MIKNNKPARTVWKRTPLALAVAIAVGSPVVQAQTSEHYPATAPGLQKNLVYGDIVTGNELVVIDAKVENLPSLLKAMPAAASWHVLDGSRDGVTQLTEIVARSSRVKAIHLISHGEDGVLRLGSSVLHQNNINKYAPLLQTLASSTVPGADLLIYGCDVAKTETGERFVNMLRKATGLDIAASDDTTGKDDWVLEIARGEITTPAIHPEGYGATLDILAGDGSGGGGSGGYYGANGGAGGGDNDTVTGTTKNDVIFGDGSGGGASGWTNGYYGGAGGGGDDVLLGGAGDDILFGDGFDGFSSGVYSEDGADGGFGGGGGGASYNGGTQGQGGLLAGNGGYGDVFLGYSGGDGIGSTGGAGATGYINGYGYGGGGGGWSDGSGAGNGADAPTSDYYGIDGTPGSTTQLSYTDTGVAGSVREVVKSLVDAGYFSGLPGGAGADTLNGGPGSDDLFGMGGADIFEFEATDAPAVNSDIDTIHDFVPGTDVIHLFANGMSIGAAARDALLLSQTATPGAADRTLLYTVGTDSVSIVVKGIGMDLTATDVPADFGSKGSGGGGGGGGGAVSLPTLLASLGMWFLGVFRRKFRS